MIFWPGLDSTFLYEYTHMKKLCFEGSNLEDLRELPREARKSNGFQLERLQAGQEPKNWKPLSSLGKGMTSVREIRTEVETNKYRSAYVTKLGDHVVVLHCWNKKTNKRLHPISRLLKSYTNQQRRIFHENKNNRIHPGRDGGRSS